MSDHDEDHREPRGSHDDYLREQGYCPDCTGTLDRDGSCRWCGTDGMEEEAE